MSEHQLSSKPEPEPKVSPRVIIGAVAGVIALVLWALTPLVMSILYPTIAERGQIGDLFGSINALFSGLAFAGVILAILLQHEELGMQRRQLSRAATAQEESQEALQKTIYTHAYKTALDILQEERIRQARNVVFTHLKSKPLETWSPEEVQAAEVVCSTYDTVGIMTKYGVLPVEWVADNWGYSLRETWKILEPFVQKYRTERKVAEYWDDYERLVMEAHKFHVKQP